MSGEGAFPINSRLAGNGSQTLGVTLFGGVTGYPDSAGGAVFTDHLFEAATPPPGGVCIAALMGATAVARTGIFGVALQ